MLTNKVLAALVGGLLLGFFFPVSTLAEECHIDSKIRFTTGDTHQDKYLCVLEWGAVKAVADRSETDTDCKVIVELIGEDDARLDSHSIRADGNAQIWHANRWYGFAEFEQAVLAADCRLPTQTETAPPGAVTQSRVILATIR